MTAEELLPKMKIDLGLSSNAFNGRLTDKLNTAIQRIQAEGCTLTDSESDQDLVLLCAEWLWLHRIDGAAMPRMIRLALNNRVFGEKASAGGST